MNGNTLVGYHATTKDRGQEILKNGFDISKSQNDNYEWLGDGVYFWDDDYYAVQWNIIDLEKKNKDKNIENLNEYTIIKSDIKVNKLKLFEMSSPEGSYIYNDFKNKLKNKFIENGCEGYVDALMKKSDKFWINLLEDNGFFNDFDVITAIYKNEKNTEKYKDDVVLNTQKQICVKNIECIIKREIYNDEKRILNLFSIILKRRENIKK